MQLSVNGVRYDFQPGTSCGRRDEHHDANGLRGTLSRDASRSLAGIYRVDGTLKLYPTATEMQTLLPWMYGTTVSTITYALADTAIPYDVVVDRILKVHTATGVAVGKSRIYGGGKNEAMGVDLDVVGLTETEGNAGSFTPASINVATKPWMFNQMTLSVNSVTCKPEMVEVIVDHVLDADRFFNSQTLTVANWTDRHVTFKARIPYGDYSAIYTSGEVSTGVPVVVTWTNGVYILTQTMSLVAIPKKNAEPQDHKELFLDLEGIAYANGATKEIVTTLAVS